MKRVTTILLLGVLLVGGLVLLADAACTNTPNLSLCKQALGDPNWHTELNSNFDKLDSPVKLVVTGTGTHVIGGMTDARWQLFLTGVAPTSTGLAAALQVGSTIAPGVGFSAFGVNIDPTLKKAASGTHTDFVSLNVAPLAMGAGAAAVTNATTLKITAAPTGATNNYALWAASDSLVRFDGTMKFGATSTGGGGAGPSLFLDPSNFLRFTGGTVGFGWYNNAGSTERMRLTDGGSFEMTAGRIVEKLTNPTYGTSVAIDASLGNTFRITATNATAFTVANPTNAATGQKMTIMIRNTSGGALGTVTWDTLYKLATWTNPANATSRSITFVYDGTNWVEINRTTTDVPN